MKDNFNLYIFTKEILTEELYSLLKEIHEYRHAEVYSKIHTLELVPGTVHFISVNSINSWSYQEKIVVTKNQADKFIQINNVIPMDFIEFIESYKE